MRVVAQRVARATVSVDGERVATIGLGFLLLVGIGADDASDEVDRLAEKVVHLRVFADAGGKMNLAIADVGGEALGRSQFPLYTDPRRGRRPPRTTAPAPSIPPQR